LLTTLCAAQFEFRPVHHEAITNVAKFVMPPVLVLTE